MNNHIQTHTNTSQKPDATLLEFSMGLRDVKTKLSSGWTTPDASWAMFELQPITTYQTQLAHSAPYSSLVLEIIMIIDHYKLSTPNKPSGVILYYPKVPKQITTSDKVVWLDCYRRRNEKKNVNKQPTHNLVHKKQIGSKDSANEEKKLQLLRKH